MQKWRYDAVVFEGLMSEDLLNNIGAQGWELVSIIRPDANKKTFIHYFKQLVNGSEARKVILEEQT